MRQYVHLVLCHCLDIRDSSFIVFLECLRVILFNVFPELLKPFQVKFRKTACLIALNIAKIFQQACKIAVKLIFGIKQNVCMGLFTETDLSFGERATQRFRRQDVDLYQRVSKSTFACFLETDNRNFKLFLFKLFEKTAVFRDDAINLESVFRIDNKQLRILAQNADERIICPLDTGT